MILQNVRPPVVPVFIFEHLNRYKVLYCHTENSQAVEESYLYAYTRQSPFLAQDRSI